MNEMKPEDFGDLDATSAQATVNKREPALVFDATRAKIATRPDSSNC